MGWDSNQVLYYGGLALVALAVFTAVISGLVLTIRTLRLNTRFDEEYGKKRG